MLLPPDLARLLHALATVVLRQPTGGVTFCQVE